VLQEEPISIRQRRPDIPEALASTIHKALAKKPEARFSDTQAFRAALAAFAQ
jgi:serine/threonine-protein kinase